MPIVQEMQKTIYTDIPEIVLYYDKTLEAYDSANWQGLEDNISPTPEGYLWGQYTPYTALTLAPRGADTGTLVVALVVHVADRGYPRSHHRGRRDRDDRSPGQVRRGSGVGSERFER